MIALASTGATRPRRFKPARDRGALADDESPCEGLPGKYAPRKCCGLASAAELIVRPVLSPRPKGMAPTYPQRAKSGVTGYGRASILVRMSAGSRNGDAEAQGRQ